MEYDIIEKMAMLACGSPSALPGKAARLVRETFSFDYCGIYLWHENRRCFVLTAFSGEPKNSIKKYAGGEGVPGLVRKKRKPVEITGGTAVGAAIAKPIDDPGLSGFKSVLAYPLMDNAFMYGVLFLKAVKKHGLTQKKRRSLVGAVKVLSVALSCVDLRARLLATQKDLIDTKARLASSEKLLTLADMASTLTHEIRSPLISIGGFARRLKNKLNSDVAAMNCVSRIEAETMRLEKLVNGMIRYFKDTPMELSVDDMNGIIEEALGSFSEDFVLHDIKVVKDLSEGPLRVLVDRDQLKIAFDNLIANAIQSMEKGGILAVRTSHADGKVIAYLTDSGGGIDPGNIKNIFTPFFTTKSFGTGLGLPITHSILTRHNGFIIVNNDAGVGVTFALNLPEAIEAGL